MEETRNEKNVKTSSAVWLGAANAGTGLLCAFAEGAAFQYLFVNKLGLDVKLNMVVWILFGIWNAVNDPIYGFLADRTKSKLGRRIPWIRYGSPILAVIYAVIWIIFPGTEGNQIFLFFQELIGLFSIQQSLAPSTSCLMKWLLLTKQEIKSSYLTSFSH